VRPIAHRAVLALAAGVLLAAPAWADSLPPAISVTGEATVSVPPDLAEVEAGVTSDAKTAREASETNNATMGKLLQALKAADIDARDIQTSRLSLQPQNAPNRAGSAAITGYRASNRVTVRLRDVSKVAGTIDMLVGAGANDIGGINFMVSQASKLLDDARRRRRPSQGRDLRQGRRRHAWGAALYFRRRLARPDAISQDDGRHGCRDAGGTRRRDAFGHRERELGDQDRGAVILTRCYTRTSS
jgi:hypothetical protein